MLRKGIQAGILAIVLATIIYIFLQLPSFRNRKNALYHFIPSNSILLIKGSSPKHLRKNLEKANAIWQKLQAVDIFNLIHELLSEEADLVDRDETLRAVLDEKQITITINKLNEKFEPLVFLDIGDEKYIKTIKQMYEGQKRIVNTFALEGMDGFTVEDRAKRKWFVVLIDHVLIIAFDKQMLRNCILEINAKRTLAYDLAFQQANNSSGNTDMVCIINNHEIYHLNNYLFKPAYFNRNIWSARQQDWTTIDFTFAPNEIKFSSIWQDRDSTSIWNYLERETELDDGYLKSIPNNTFGFSTINLENYTDFFNYQWRNFDEEKRRNLVKYYASFSKDYPENIADKFKGMIHSRIINIKTKVDTLGFNELSLLEVKDTAGLGELLVAMSDSIFKEPFVVYRLKKNDVFNKLSFNYLQAKKSQYLTVKYPYLVFSNNRSALNNYNVLIKEGKHLYNDKPTQHYLEKKFQNNSMFFTFERWHNLEFSKMDWLNEKHFDRARGYLNFLKLMDFSGLQMSFKNKQVMLQGNIQTYRELDAESDQGLLWDKPLEAPIRQLKIIYNHKSQSKDVFVIDSSHQVYLYNSSGMLLWRKMIDDSIIGEIKAIDWFKNKKTQILLNTKTKIYCFDINGELLKGFPIALEDTCTNSANLFDYDNDNNYRFLYTNTKMQLKNVTTDGNALGFKPFQMDAISNTSVNFLRADSKDHLVLIDTTGQIYLVDRRGRLIKKLIQKIKWSNQIQMLFTNKLRQSKIYYAYDKTFGYVSLDDDKTEQTFNYQSIDLNTIDKRLYITYFKDNKWGILNENGDATYAFNGERRVQNQILNIKLNDTLFHLMRYEDDKGIWLQSLKRQIQINNFPSFQGLLFYQPTDDLNYFIKMEENHLKCFYFQEIF